MVYVYEGIYRVRLGIKKLFNHNKKTIQTLYRDHKVTLGSTTKEKHSFSNLLVEFMFPIRSR